MKPINPTTPAGHPMAPSSTLLKPPLRRRLPISIAAVLASTAFSVSLMAGTCTADFANIKQTIRGFGAATVTWQGTITDNHMNIGFGQAGGVGLTIARIRIPPTTTQSDWSGEVSNGARAKSRGAIVIASPWSPPASMKDNNSTIDGYLRTSSYGAYATHLHNFVNYCNNNGSGLYGISVQNEPDIDVDYESCFWTADQMRNFCRDQMGIFYTTKVMAPESFQFRKIMSDTLLNDSAARANVDIINGHVYGGGIATYPLATSNGKELWMTEILDTSTSLSAVIGTGKQIHDCMNVAGFNSYVWWYVKRDYGPVNEAGARTKRGCVIAQYSRLVRPGSVRVACTANPSTGVFVTAYKNGSKAVIVAVNTSTSSVSQPFSIVGQSVSSLNRWRTSGSQDLATLSAITVSGGAFTDSLPGQSVTSYYQP
jgi:glucuronoarabinoxylan endo-1,4-beta-xylanase